MARRQRIEREAYWQDLIDRQGSSEQAIAEFCRDERVSTASFYAWRLRLRSRRRLVHPQTSGQALSQRCSWPRIPEVQTRRSSNNWLPLGFIGSTS
jgi:hypothetical protein